MPSLVIVLLIKPADKKLKVVRFCHHAAESRSRFKSVTKAPVLVLPAKLIVLLQMAPSVVIHLAVTFEESISKWASAMQFCSRVSPALFLEITPPQCWQNKLLTSAGCNRGILFTMLLWVDLSCFFTCSTIDIGYKLTIYLVTLSLISIHFVSATWHFPAKDTLLRTYAIQMTAVTLTIGYVTFSAGGPEPL